jgi:hypothetical protein
MVAHVNEVILPLGYVQQSSIPFIRTESWFESRGHYHPCYPCLIETGCVAYAPVAQSGRRCGLRTRMLEVQILSGAPNNLYPVRQVGLRHWILIPAF